MYRAVFCTNRILIILKIENTAFFMLHREIKKEEKEMANPIRHLFVFGVDIGHHLFTHKSSG
jgi:hypothetical protein